MRKTLALLAIFTLGNTCEQPVNDGGSTCVPGTKSMDPCPQVGTPCAQAGGVALACCINGQFETILDPMSGNAVAKCQCEQANEGILIQCGANGSVVGGIGGMGGMGGTSGTVPAPVCGNGIVEDGEQCDGMDLHGASCMTMNMGMGMLQCLGSCTYDTSMCVGDHSTGGTGGGGTGG